MKEKGGLVGVGMGLDGVRRGWPGGMRDGRILRFAEADTDLISAFLLRSSNTAAAGAGRIQSLRAFRRAGKREMGRGKMDDG